MLFRRERRGRASGAISLQVHPPSDFFCCYPSPSFFDFIARPRRRLAHELVRACTHKIAIGDSDLINVCIAPLCGLKSDISRGQRSAKSGCEQSQQAPCTVATIYSITSSATESSDGGTVSPSILAVSALMTSSNLVDCTTGNSAGFTPLRMRPV